MVGAKALGAHAQRLASVRQRLTQLALLDEQLREIRRCDLQLAAAVAAAQVSRVGHKPVGLLSHQSLRLRKLAAPRQDLRQIRRCEPRVCVRLPEAQACARGRLVSQSLALVVAAERLHGLG